MAVDLGGICFRIADLFNDPAAFSLVQAYLFTYQNSQDPGTANLGN